MSALEAKINTARQSNQANDHHSNPESPYQINQDSHQKHNQESNDQGNQESHQKHNQESYQESNQAQIEGLYKNTQTSLNSLLKTQRKHTNEIVFKLEQGQANTQTTIGQLKHSIGQFIDKINALLNQQTSKTAKPIPLQQTNTTTNTAVFELVDISLWDFKPQATIRYQGKMSIVDEGSVRVGWKIVNIDFDKEQISIANVKNGQQITLQKIR